MNEMHMTQPMSFEQASFKVKQLPAEVKLMLTQIGKPHHRAHHTEHAHALQQHGSSPTGDVAGALDKAKETLNNMMEETEAELDEAILECTEYDRHTVALLDENTRYRAQLGEEVAQARADIADAETVINEARGELESIRLAAEESAAQCAASIKVARDGLALLENDLQISMRVENMTNCDEEDTTLLECGAGYSRRFHFAGRAAASLSQVKTKQGMLAVQRAARMALGKDTTKMKETFPKAFKKHRRKKQDPIELPAGVENVNKSAPASEETLQAIENLTVAEMPEEQSYDPNELMKKCSVSGSSSCPMIRDALSQLTAEVRWARDQAQAALDALEAECKRMADDYAQQTADWEHTLQVNNVKLATATGALNTAEEAIRLKVGEANELIGELTQHRHDCGEKIREGAETLCGIKTIRQELYQMNGVNPFMQDCVVSEWMPGECSAECAGGEQTMSRTIVVQPNGGAACPPLVEKGSCNMQPCPINCVMGDWSEYSACSKDCGGGIMQRSRLVITEAEHGGEACGEAIDPVQCNVAACDRPCELGMWSDWGECNKACNGGMQTRFREVTAEAGPTGYCPEPDDEARLGMRPCNEMDCPPDIFVYDKIDLVVMVDGSGSVEWTPGGFREEQMFTEKLFSLLDFGDEGAKAGVVLFSWEAELIHEMTQDKAALEASVDGMSWPGWNTDTAAAIMMAQTTLTNGGRPDVPKEKSIAFLITDGNPNDLTATNAAAADLRERARLIVITVGTNIDQVAVDGCESLMRKMGEFLSDLTPLIGCKETMTGDGNDYVGCQSTTRSGLQCQGWNQQEPHTHNFLPDQFPHAHLGNHNFCRNPIGSDTRYFLAEQGSNSCGADGIPVPEEACDAAAKSVLPPDAEQGRPTLVAGSWDHVPAGCSVQSDGDWASHYNRRGSPSASRGNEYSPVCQEAKVTYVLGEAGATSCEGVGEELTEAECEHAGGLLVAGAGNTQGRTLVTGSWSHVPSGCTVQSTGDWASHYNRLANSAASRANEYTPVCRAGEEKTIWCYTTDPSVRWESCDPRETTEIPKDFQYLVTEVPDADIVEEE